MKRLTPDEVFPPAMRRIVAGLPRPTLEAMTAEEQAVLKWRVARMLLAQP
jgi:hypothetical protein